MAWSILAGTALFGNTVLGVRFFAVVASLVTTLALAGLAREAGGGRRAALFAAVLFQLVPVFQGTSVLMTIDGPFLMCWTLAAWAGLRILRTGGESKGPWLALGATIGAGFLFKYTMLLIVVAFALFAALGKRWPRTPRSVAGLLAATATAGAAMSPVFFWNQRQGWPTVRHLLGHLGLAGGDLPTTGESWDPLWTLEYIGGQLAMIGPFAAFLLVRSITRVAHRASPERLYLILLGLVPLVFYLGVSFLADVEANWPIAGYLTAIALAALTLEASWASRADLQRAWTATTAFGIIAAIVLHGLPLFSAIPQVGPRLPLHRVTGHRVLAEDVDGVLRDLELKTGNRPQVVTDHYMTASLLAFYLPGRPVVRCASAWLGGRRTQYDHFVDTRIDGPDRLAGPLVMVGADEAAWRSFLPGEQLENHGLAGVGRGRRAVFSVGGYGERR